MSEAQWQDAERLRRAGRLAEAAGIYGAILSAEPHHAGALHALGLVRYQAGEIAEAERLIGAAADLNPGAADVFYNRACLLRKLKREPEALAAFDRAIALKPDYVAALVNRASVLLTLARAGDALADLDAVAALRPDMAEIWNNRGGALVKLGRFEEAIASHTRAMALRPADAGLRRNRGTAHFLAGLYGEALADFDAALGLGADDAETWSRRGSALFELRRLDEAIAGFDTALIRAPNDADTLFRRANARLALRRFAAAAEDYEALLARAPDYPDAPGSLAFCRLCLCDWEGADAAAANMRAASARGVRAVTPFQNIALGASEADALGVAQAMASSWPAAPPFRNAPSDKIRVAYVSANFNTHAVAELMAGVFERHDRTRFEATALALGPGDGGAMRARLARAFDRFEEAGTRDDAQLAGFLRAAGTDIAIDLMGYTEGCRPGIFAARAAPVQVNYLGFPGTMGAPFMDYILADRIVIPEAHRRHYAEQVAYLPHAYLPHDATRAIAARTPTRSQAGLPEKGFVFCSFNNSYKFSARLFACWMRLIARVAGSVLWLPQVDPDAMRALKRAAEAQGVASARLVFAPRLAAMADHLARLRLADLFLDTNPYNAHTTACDALWAGVPLVTWAGEGFAGRVAASLVRAAGLPELAAANEDDYEAMALRFARDEAALARVRAKLARARGEAALFDTARFTRNLEAAFTAMWQRHLQGLAPEAFGLEDVGSVRA
jgi:predicted O-linked N-acetylglucosamine transferase (SPINDLY family)